MMNDPLFEGKGILLAAPDAERDAETVSCWTHDPDFLRLTETGSGQPLAPAQVREAFESDRKKGGMQSAYTFVIRGRTDNRLLGTVKLYSIGWAHGFARLQLAIGDPADRGQGYGSEALALILRFAFDELNLFRVAATTCSYNGGALRWLERSGFVTEVRQREAIMRAGKRWDHIHMAILRPEWEASQARGVGV